MEKTYSSSQNNYRTAATVKQFFIVVILILSGCLNNVFGITGVVITAPSLTVTGCSFPTPYFPLGNIVITENTNSDISGFGTLVLSAPTNFEFQPSTGTVSFAASGNIVGCSIIITLNTITVTVSGSGTTLPDAITISGLQVRGVNSESGPLLITRTSGSSTILGDGLGIVHATLTSVLNSVTPGSIAGAQTVCAGGNPLAFTESAASTGAGTLSYQWKQSSDSYSATLSTALTYDVPAGLANTTTYRRVTISTLNGGTCPANSNDILVTINNSSPGSITSSQTICNGGDPAPFSDITAPSGSGALTYFWRKSTDGYSSDIGFAQTYDVPPGLTDTTSYHRRTTSTLGTSTCTTNSNNVTITVMPAVIGGSVTPPQSICSGATPTALTGATPTGGNGSFTYLWESSTISPTNGFTAATFTNTLSSYSPNSLSTTTWYRRKVTSAGCAAHDTAAIAMTVLIPNVTNSPSFTTCSGTNFNLGLTANITSNFSWTIGTITGTITGATLGSGNNIIQTLTNPSNINSGTVQYIVTPTSAPGGCSGPSFTITVTVNPLPAVTSGTTYTICSGTSPNVNLTSSMPSTFSWVLGTITGGITGASNGSGTIINQILNNPNASPGTVPYLVTPASGSCIGNTATITAIVNPIPLANAGPDVSICLGSSTTLTASGGASYTWYNGGSSISAASSLIVTPSATTSYKADVTNSFGCLKSDSVVVTVTPMPVITATTPASRCGTGIVTLAAAVSNGTIHWWDAATGGTDLAQGSTFNTPAISSTTTYYVDAIANGCVSTTRTSIIATVNLIPVLTATTTSSIICAGNSTTLTASGTGITSYLWSTGGITSSITDSPSATTTYTITGTDANTCSNTATVLVTVNPIPTASSSSQTLCTGNTTSILLTSDVPGTVFSWTVTPNGITGASSGSSSSTIAQTLTTTGSTFGTALYSITPTANSCLGLPISVTITVNPDAVITRTSSIGTDAQTICLNNSIANIIYSVTAGGTGASASGLPTGVSSTYSSGILTISGSALTSGLYSYAVTTTGTCVQATATGNITVNPKPVVLTTDPSAICSPATTDLTLPAITAGSTSGLTFSYYSDAGATIPYTTPVIADNGMYYIVGLITSSGCSDTTSVTVTVNPKPILITTAPASVCSPETVDLTLPSITAGSTAGLTFSYFTDAGATISYATPTMATNGTFYIVGTLTSSGCSDTTAITVSVNPKPTVLTTNPSAVCSPETIDITLPSITVGSTAGLTFSYFADAGATIPYSTPTIADSGTYYIVGVITSTGCSDTSAVAVTVNPKPIILTTNPPPACAPETIDITLPAITTGSTSGLTFSYFMDAGATLTYATPTIADSGMYYLVGILTSSGCSDTTSVAVTINPKPIVITTDPAAVCSPATADLTLPAITTGSTSGLVYSYYTDAGATLVYNTPAIAAGGTYYILGVLTSTGCADTTGVFVTVNPSPTANAGADQTICHGDTATLVGGTGGTAYSWTDGITAYNTQTILVNPNTSTLYTLAVTGSLGCIAYDTAMVNVTPSKDIYGHVGYSGGNVVNGTVVLFKYVQFQTRFDSVLVDTLNSTGNYLFNNINYGDYLVKVFVDSANYPALINTYYGDGYLWNDSSIIIINHSCGTNDTANVTMVELAPSQVGPGLIIGQIIEGLNFGRNEGEPIPGVDIKLGKNPGGIIAHTQTNSGGYYTFSGVDFGNYTIYVDIPGLGRDSSYTFNIDSTNNQFIHQDYIADSTTIYVNPTSSVGISNPTTIFENKFNVYPNPVKGNTTIEYNILQVTEEKTTLEVYNILGVKIGTLVNSNQQIGLYKYSFNPENYNLNSGVYFITLTIDGKVKTKRIVVIE